MAGAVTGIQIGGSKVQTAAGAVTAASQAYEVRKAAGESKESALVGGIHDVLAADSITTTIERNAPLILLGLVVLVFLMVGRRR